MDLTQIAFWILSALAIFSALMVITRKNPVYSVIFLIITFFAISGHYVLLNAQFLAVVNLIVYAGAIMVLFLFVIMLMNLNKDLGLKKRKIMIAVSAFVGVVFMLVIILALYTPNSQLIANPGGGEIGLVQNLGRKLFTEYVIAFEVASILFLAAMVGAVMLSKKGK